jgi:hypothetical protein
MQALSTYQYLPQPERPCAVPAPTQAPRKSPSTQPCDRLDSIAQAFVEVVEGWSCVAQDVIRLSTLATELVGLFDESPQLCLGMAPHLPFQSAALRHAFHVAVLGVHLAHGMQMNAERQLVVAKAAMIMNLTSAEFQDDLAGVKKRLSPAQRFNLARHPILAADLLMASPGVDLRWIDAVEQHHESLDGSGYPHALKGDEICPEARILRLADAWCALVAPRPYRAPKWPQEAFHWLLSRNRQCFDARLIDLLRRVSGHYPAGTIVRLASRETAIIVGTPRQAVAFVGTQGTLYRDPVLRDSSRAQFSLRSYTTLPVLKISSSYWDRVWNLARKA